MIVIIHCYIGGNVNNNPVMVPYVKNNECTYVLQLKQEKT